MLPTLRVLPALPILPIFPALPALPVLPALPFIPFRLAICAKSPCNLPQIAKQKTAFCKTLEINTLHKGCFHVIMTHKNYDDRYSLASCFSVDKTLSLQSRQARLTVNKQSADKQTRYGRGVSKWANIPCRDIISLTLTFGSLCPHVSRETYHTGIQELKRSFRACGHNEPKVSVKLIMSLQGRYSQF